MVLSARHSDLLYVFGQDTLVRALELWVKVRSDKASEKEEMFRITQVALPWFLKHLGQTSTVCTFSESDMLRELDYWKADQMVSFPHQKTRIEETCDLIVDFFHSDIVKQHKMVVS